tara:strand:- start:12 stop:677 length:666 start_codon:yes stop_codon:yes gene_type:complete
MKTFTDLQEGVYDPNIFKAFFLAGGPGSGKSYVVRKTTGGLGMKIVNSDDVFEKYLEQAGLSLDTTELDPRVRDKLYMKAKKATSKRQDNYIEGRLGLIIDGTGADYDRISNQKAKLDNIGYDTYMIFVNTSLDTALERNQKRDRVLKDSLVINLWKSVQKNIGKFNILFRPSNFIIVDNNDAMQDLMIPIIKIVRSYAKKKVTNHIAKMWIANELEKKKR